MIVIILGRYKVSGMLDITLVFDNIEYEGSVKQICEKNGQSLVAYKSFDETLRMDLEHYCNKNSEFKGAIEDLMTKAVQVALTIQK